MRKLSIALAMGVASAALAGCGSAPSPSPSPSPASSEAASPTTAQGLPGSTDSAAVESPAAQGVPGGVVPNSYACSAFMGMPPNGHMQPIPGFTIAADGSYTHQDGSTGTVAVENAMLLFHGGSLDGQAATFDAGAAGRGTVHLYNESRSRTVIDCEGG
ncbi:MAG: hypothetical protein JWN66_2633 [Sphingomonas bacterium]|uniref:hypothetical protein n=1 Tax=Sphingomonas bacterium TaxID=1895847 RepID=UPI0026234B26|nr:hypothetical protein [Sphingomonas bacterium]MDB5705517.1 hypothetical protein [Sphingomonas bacterium]